MSSGLVHHVCFDGCHYRCIHWGATRVSFVTAKGRTDVGGSRAWAAVVWRLRRRRRRNGGDWGGGPGPGKKRR